MTKDELAVGSTIYRRNGTAVVIAGETKVSWLIGTHSWSQTKIKKSAMRKGNSGENWPQYFAHEHDALDCIFAANNSYGISNRVRDMNDGKLLRQIAELIGYVEVVK